MERIKMTPGTVLNIIGYDARLLLLSLSLMCTIPSCGPCKNIPITQKDSVAVRYIDSTHIVEKVVTRDSLVYIPIPVENSQNTLPGITPSHLETSLAESDAYVDSLGLHHTLSNKRGSLEAYVKIIERYLSEIQKTQKDSVKAETKTKIVEVEKPHSKWEKFRLDVFPWLCGLIVMLLLWTFRKKIFKI